MDLDGLLDESAPPVVSRTAELSRELSAMLADSEVTTAPRRRRFPVVVAGSLAAGAVALAGTAAAAGYLPAGWTPWSTSSGASCQMTFDAVINGYGGNVMNPAPGLAQMSLADRQVVLAAARQFLASFDYASINRQDAIEKWKAAVAKVNAGEPADERQSIETGDELELTAVNAEVNRQLDDYLQARGLNPNAIIATGTNRCDR